jgi:hypothetical protein
MMRSGYLHGKSCPLASYYLELLIPQAFSMACQPCIVRRVGLSRLCSKPSHRGWAVLDLTVPGQPGSVFPVLIIRLVIQTIRLDRSGSVWIDEASNVSRADRSGAGQIDAEHQATDLVACTTIRQHACRAPTAVRSGRAR